MALKLKGRDRTGKPPKAGPKKARAKREEEAIRQAVEQNTRAPKATRKAGRTRSYTFKEPVAPKAKPEVKLSDPRELRGPRAPSDFDIFAANLDDDERPRATALYQMECAHHEEEEVARFNSVSGGIEPILMRCTCCGLSRRWWGNRTATLQAEWQSLRVAGYDMAEWGELFTKDKTLWRFIIVEAAAELEGDAND